MIEGIIKKVERIRDFLKWHRDIMKKEGRSFDIQDDEVILREKNVILEALEMLKDSIEKKIN